MERRKVHLTLSTLAIAGGVFVSSCQAGTDNYSPMTATPPPSSAELYSMLNTDQVVMSEGSEDISLNDRVQIFGSELQSEKPENLAFQELQSSEGTLYEPEAVLAPHISQRLSEVLRVVNLMLQPDSQLDYAAVFTHNIEDLSGSPDVDKRRVNIFVPSGSEVSLSELEMITFHEGMHVVQGETELSNYGWDSPTLGPFYNRLDDDRKRRINVAQNVLLENGIDENTARLFVTDIIMNDAEVEKLHPLFNVLDESSYGASGGHPYGNPGELFASATTIMRYFPDGFMNTLRNLDAVDAEIIAGTARGVLSIVESSLKERDNLTDIIDARVLEAVGY